MRMRTNCAIYQFKRTEPNVELTQNQCQLMGPTRCLAAHVLQAAQRPATSAVHTWLMRACSFAFTSSTVSVGSTCKNTVTFLRLQRMYILTYQAARRSSAAPEAGASCCLGCRACLIT